MGKIRNMTLPDIFGLVVEFPNPTPLEVVRFVVET